MFRLLLLLLGCSLVVSYNLKVCSDYGHNWAGEIRCLRSMLAQCHDGSPGREAGLPTSRPYIRAIRAGPGEEARTIDTRVASRYSQHRNGVDYAAVMKNVTEVVEQRVAQVREMLEKEMGRRINELRNWMDGELKRIESGAGLPDVAVIRQNELEIKKLIRRVDLLSAKVHRFGQNEYAFIMTRESWYRAEEICLEWGGHLASVATVEENQFLASLLDGESAWIGLNDVQLENVYVNTDRSQTKFRLWAKGQPDNQNHNENCIEMTRTGQWADLLCLLRRPFFCKLELQHIYPPNFEI